MSRRRQHGGRHARTGRSRGPSRSPEAALARATAEILAGVRGAVVGLAAGDALDAELVASGLLSIFHADEPEDEEPAKELGTAVLRKLAARPDADAFALLLATAALASPPFDGVAREALETARAAGIPEPGWAPSIGRPALVDAWTSADELEDQANLALVFAYDGRPPHVLVAMTDANFGGLIRMAFIAENPAKVRQEWTDASGLPVRPIAEQDLADQLARGIEQFDRYLDPPVDDEGRRLMPLIRARLRLLPAPRPVEVPETPEEARDELAREFAASPEAAALAAAELDRAEDIAHWFIDFACDHGAGDPLRWSPIAVELLLADWLPRKAILDPGEVTVLPAVLRAFVRFAARRKHLAEPVFAETLETVDGFGAEFADAMADDELAGPAKQIAVRMHGDGVDLADEAAVAAWIERYNREVDRR
jgi:hypothetical protein